MVQLTFDLPRNNYGTIEKNYGTIEKTMVLWKVYGTIQRTVELRFTKEKNLADYQKLRNFDL